MRFRWLVVVGVAGILGIGAPLTPSPMAEAAAGPINKIVEENRHSGTNRWVIPWSSAHRIADDFNRQIKGYASATSVNVGQSINLHVSMNPAGTFTYDVYRIGWYGGSGGRHMTRGTASSADRGDCAIIASTGLRQCQWPVSATVAVPQSWTSGAYAVVLTHLGTNYQNYIIFTVRDDVRQDALVHMQTVLTGQAYSQYPDNGLNGKSLYDYNSKGPNTVAGSPRAVKVSLTGRMPATEQVICSSMTRRSSIGPSRVDTTSNTPPTSTCTPTRTYWSGSKGWSRPGTTSTGPPRCSLPQKGHATRELGWRSLEVTMCSGRSGSNPRAQESPTVS